MPNARVARLAVLSIVLIGACKKPQAAPPAADSVTAALPEGHVPISRAIPLEPAAQVVLDSANAAYTAKRYDQALALYRRTLELAPGHPAPWFGISMAANMLGDSVLADSAQRLLKLKGADGGAHAAPAAPVNPHAMPANPHGANPATVPPATRPSGS